MKAYALSSDKARNEDADSSTGTMFISAGLILAIEDLLLSALTTPDYFNSPELHDPKDESRAILPIPVLRAEWKDKPPTRGFGWLEDIAAGHSISILNLMPQAPWRLVQFELLRELCIHWVMLHEFAHWALGHLGALTSANSKAKASLALSDAVLGLLDADRMKMLAGLAKFVSASTAPGLGAIDGTTVGRSIELSADRWAIHYLIRLHEAERDHPDNVFSRHRRAMRAIRLPREFDPSTELEENRRVRAYITAAGAVALILFSNERDGSKSDDYPPAISRLINILNAAFASSPFVDITAGGVTFETAIADEPEFIAYMRDAWLQPQIDFRFLNRALGVEPFLAFDAETDAPLYSEVLEDILRLFDPTADIDSFGTEAGQDYFKLKEPTEAVETACSPFALVTKLRL
ncbi:MAG: hypothetical protein WB816_01255 [Methylocystis sp.]